jgi:hypothetical protein
MNNILLIGIIITLFFLYLFLNKKKVKVYGLENKIKQQINTQSNFVKPNNAFYHLFDKISIELSQENKIELTKQSVESMYTRDTIPENLLGFLKKLIDNTIEKTIKIRQNVDYYIKNIIEVYQQVDINKNQRYIIKCFIYDIKNFYDVKILLDIVVINDNVYVNYIGNDISSQINILNKYDKKLSRVGYLYNRNNINDNVKQIIDSYYKQNFNLIGYDASPLEYSHYISKLDTVYTYNIDDLSKYYVPPDIPTLNDPRFGQNHLSEWDEHGVDLNTGNNNYVHNTSYFEKSNVPLNLPGSDPYTRSYDGVYNLQKVGFNQPGSLITTNSHYY